MRRRLCGLIPMRPCVFANAWCWAVSAVLIVGVAVHAFGQPVDAQPEALKQDKLSRLLVEMGWRDLEAGAPALAQESFLRALTRFPDDPHAISGLGTALLDQQRVEEALALLEPAIQRFPQDAQLVAVLGHAYMATEDRGKDAVAAFERAKKLKPDWQEVNGWLGTAYLRIGRVVSAMETLDQSKTDDSGTRLSQSMALAQLGLHGEARRRLSSLMTDLPGTGWADAASLLQGQLDDQAQAKKLYGAIKVAQQFDDNPGLIPLTDVFGDVANGESSFATLVSGQFIYDVVRGDKTDVVAGYSILYTANYSAHNFDLQDHALFAAVSRRGLWGHQPYELGMRVDYDYLFVGQNGFLQRVSATPTLTLAQSDQTSTTVLFRYSMLDFLGQGIDQGTQDDQDSNNMLTGMTQAFLLPWDHATLEVGYQYDSNLAQGSNFDYNGHKLIAALNWPLPVGDMNLALVGSAYFRLYNNPNTFDPTRRRDMQYTLSTVLTCPIEERINLIFEYLFDRNDSNLAFNDFTRQVFSIGLEYKF